jgi:hypothetical protein
LVDIKSAVGALRSDAGIRDDAAQDVDGPRQAIGSSMYGMDAGTDAAAIAAIATAAGVSIGVVTTAILSPQSLTNTIAQKVHDLGDQWAKSNVEAMQDKSDWHVMR